MDSEDIYFDDHPSLSASLEDFEEENGNHNNDNDNNQNHSPRPPFTIPSQHSGFRSGNSNADDIDIDLDANADLDSSASHLSPQGFRPRHPGSAWYRHQPYGNFDRDRFRDLRPGPSLLATSRSSPARSSREPSPQYEDAVEGAPVSGRVVDGDLTLPANIPLPPGTDSPLKGRSPSPDRFSATGGQDEHDSPALNNCIYPLFVIKWDKTKC